MSSQELIEGLRLHSTALEHTNRKATAKIVAQAADALEFQGLELAALKAQQSCVATADEIRAACSTAVDVFSGEPNADQCREVAEYMREVLLARINASPAGDCRVVAWLAGQVCGGDAHHNTVNVKLESPAPWSELRIGTTVVLAAPYKPAGEVMP